jgi:hypothetical protein
MNSVRIPVTVVVIVLATTVVALCPAQGVPFGPTVRVSVSGLGSEGQAASGTGTNLAVAVARDGQFVAFESEAALDPNDTNGTSDIYLRDWTAGRTTLVSVTPAGVAGNGSSFTPSISDDGTLIAFMSFAEDLVPQDTNGAPDVFVHDRLSGLTRRASVSSLGVEALGSSHSPVISGDGSCVAFASTAFNLVAGDTNFRDDVFVHELTTGLTTRVSVSSAGVQGDRHSGPGSSASIGSRGLHISADGGFVVFVSEAAQLVIPPSQGIDFHVYLHDRGMGTTVLVGRDASGQDVSSAEGPLTLIEPGPRVLLNARLTFGTFLRTILWDMSGVRTSLFSETWTPLTALGWVYAASRDGSRMAAPGYVPSTTTASPVMVHHHPSGPTLVGSLNDQGELPLTNGNWLGTALSPDGRWLAWVSDASNVVANDTNGLPDVFLTDLGPWTSLGGALATAPPTGTMLNATNFGPPVLWGVGDLDPTRTSWLTVQRGPLSAPGLLSVSNTSLPTTAGGATLLAWPPGFLLPFVTSPSGTASFPYDWPGGMGIEFFAQAAFQDPLSQGSLAVTNAVRVVSTQ